MRDRFSQLRLHRAASREIRMVHQGTLRSGDRVTIGFALDRLASGPAGIHLSAVREGGQPPASDGARVLPGGSETLILSLTAPGRLKIVVETASPSDAATLTVTTGAGLVRERAQTLGDTVWIYFVT